MVDNKQESPKPIPLSGYLDAVLSFLMPFFGLLFLQAVVFWFQVLPAIPETAVRPSIIGIVTVSSIVGVFNAVRYMQKAYKL